MSAPTLDMAMRDIVFIANGEPVEGVDVDTYLADLVRSCDIVIPEHVLALQVDDEFTARCGELLDYFEQSPNISVVRSTEQAKARIASLPRTQVEPVTAVLVTTSLIVAVVLAARIKRLKVGPVEADFYEGVPPEVAELARQAAPKVESQLSTLLEQADNNTK